jgi:hypothetical protein|tara:strand:+ start:913 stop:1107 length:195 start_codon:yes stop_codon:yes gene_type:complete
MKSILKRYSLALLGLILFSSGICILGESIIMKYESQNWVLFGTISLILINAGLGFMIKYKWGSF